MNNETENIKALTVKNPYATMIAEGRKTIEVRSRRTKYRGDLVITSSAKPMIPGMYSGATLARVEIYDVKPVRELTTKEWEQTGIESNRDEFRDCFAWMLRNPRRLVEMPVKGNLGIFNLEIHPDDLVEYPQALPKFIKPHRSRGRQVLVAIGYLVLIGGGSIVLLIAFVWFYYNIQA